MPPEGFEPTVSAGLRLRLCGYWDRHQLLKGRKNKFPMHQWSRQQVCETCVMAVVTRTLCPSGWNRLCEQKFVASRRSKLTFDVSVCSSARFLDKEETNTGANVFHQRVICRFKYVTSPLRFKILTGTNTKKPAFLGAIQCTLLQSYQSFERLKPTTLIRNAVIFIYQTIRHHVREDSNSQWFLMPIYCRQKCAVTAVHSPWYSIAHYCNIMITTLQHTTQLSHCISQRQLGRHVSTFLQGRSSKFVHIKTYKVAWLWVYYRRNFSLYVLFTLSVHHVALSVHYAILSVYYTIMLGYYVTQCAMLHNMLHRQYDMLYCQYTMLHCQYTKLRKTVQKVYISQLMFKLYPTEVG